MSLFTMMIGSEGLDEFRSGSAVWFVAESLVDGARSVWLVELSGGEIGDGSSSGDSGFGLTTTGGEGYDSSSSGGSSG